jgi:hypothetical protein
MKKISFRSVLFRNESGYYFKPATNADKTALDIFFQENEGKYLTITCSQRKGNKTYDQVKAVWALIYILYESIYGGKPNTEQAASMYSALIEDYAPREPNPLREGKDMPVTLSRMSKSQASVFIQSIINEICLHHKLSDDAQADLQELFAEFQEHKGTFTDDPVDFGENGEMLSIDEWVKRNPVSMASGRTENLEIAHILTRGAYPQFADCTWNMMRLTHEEHIGIMHNQINKNGEITKDEWGLFLQIYPHLRKRVERARNIAYKIDQLNNSTTLDNV